MGIKFANGFIQFLNMLFNIPTKSRNLVNRNVVEGVEAVVDVLHKSCKLFNQVARRATNRSLRATLFNLAREANYYYKELCNQSQLLTEKSIAVANDWNIIPLYFENKYDNSEELLNDCYAIQNAILKTYRDLLNQGVVKFETRRLLQEQLNNFANAFVQLKSLQSAKVY
jgi:ATP-dependent helicase YprA (DUF1998 family)